MPLRAYLVDDEPLALTRLARLLSKTGRVEIAGSNTDPLAALEFLRSSEVDALFLDIQMPDLTGFELLEKLPRPPLVVFTTAYDQYALKAFEVNSIDYLLKPIDPERLDRSLDRIERLRAAPPSAADLRKMFESLAASVRHRAADYPERIASRIGERICFLDLSCVTHFYAQDKLTYAAAGGKAYCVDRTISDLEQCLDPKRFIRIHRAVIVNTDWLAEVTRTFAGGLAIRLRDANHTVLTVSRNRAGDLKSKLGF